MATKKLIAEILEARVGKLDREIIRRVRSASDIVVFGSFAASLENASSDLDVFCVGESRMHFRSASIEILILPEWDVYSEIWLTSELANHISFFGMPMASKPEWFAQAKTGTEAAVRKEKRISAYLRSFENYWQNLSPAAKARYELKIRREFQRLHLLNNLQPIPPTKVLDTGFEGRFNLSDQKFRLISEFQRKKLCEYFPNSMKI